MADQINAKYIEKLATKAAKNRFSWLARRKLKKLHAQLVGLSEGKNIVMDSTEALELRKYFFISTRKVFRKLQGHPSKLAAAQKRLIKISRKLVKQGVKTTPIDKNPLEALTNDMSHLLQHARGNSDMEKAIEKMLDTSFRMYKKHPSHWSVRNLATNKSNAHYFQPPIGELTKIIVEYNAQYPKSKMLEKYTNLVAKRFHEQSTNDYYGLDMMRTALTSISDPKQRVALAKVMRGAQQHHKATSTRGTRFKEYLRETYHAVRNPVWQFRYA